MMELCGVKGSLPTIVYISIKYNDDSCPEQYIELAIACEQKLLSDKYLIAAILYNWNAVVLIKDFFLYNNRA